MTGPGAASLSVTQRNATLARKLYYDFCVIVGHPATLPPEINCPAAFDLEYDGVFYAGNRKLAAFEYAASGCQSIQLSAGSHQASTVIFGKSAAAVPASFTADLAAVLRVRPATVYQDPAGVSGSAPPNT